MPPKKAPKKRTRGDEEAPRLSQTSRLSSGSPSQRAEAPQFLDEAALKPLRATIGAVGLEGQAVELVPMTVQSDGKTILGWHGTFRNIAVRISDSDIMYATALVSAVLPASA
jgi:hypothetical protein